MVASDWPVSDFTFRAGVELEPSPMPKGPRGERRPADVIGNADAHRAHRYREIEDDTKAPDAAKEYMRQGGLKGGKARAEKLTAAQGSEIAPVAASAR